jgi:enoyl-CoA hydratase
MKTFENIIYTVERGRAIITLNRPERRNAMSLGLLRELNEALWEADDDQAVHAVILKGAGTCFSSGYDLTPAVFAKREHKDDTKKYRDGSIYTDTTTIEDDSWRLEYSQRLRMAIFDMHKPVVAQVHGYCLAGGTDVALLCDIIIAAEDARIGVPPTRGLGVTPNHMWIYHMGPQWAKRLLLTGDMIGGKDAAKLGLVLEAVPAEELEAYVDALVDRMVLIHPDMLSGAKRQVNMAMELMGARTMQRMAAEMDARVHASPSSLKFREWMEQHGVAKGVRMRDEPFGNSLIQLRALGD